MKITEHQLERFINALDKTTNYPLIQKDDETYDDLVELQKILMSYET